MELQDIIQDLQTSLDNFQSRLNMLKTVQTGQLFDIDMLMTRKEAASFLKKSVRQIDRLCMKRILKREYIDGAVRIRRSDLLRYKGLDIVPLSEKDITKSEFEQILEKYN